MRLVRSCTLPWINSVTLYKLSERRRLKALLPMTGNSCETHFLSLPESYSIKSARSYNSKRYMQEILIRFFKISREWFDRRVFFPTFRFVFLLHIVCFGIPHSKVLVVENSFLCRQYYIVSMTFEPRY